MATKSDICVKTCQIAERIAVACANPFHKPTFLHWSDAAMLTTAAERISELEAQVERQQHALEMALKLALSAIGKS